MNNKDAWRYTYIGSDEWIIDNYKTENEEDKIIGFLDGSLNDNSKPDMYSLIHSLPKRYSSILYSYYYEGSTLEQMGKERNVTKQYMHQELKKSLAFLKKKL